MTINKSARRSHLMTSVSTRRILLEGFGSSPNEFSNMHQRQKENKEKNMPGRQMLRFHPTEQECCRLLG